MLYPNGSTSVSIDVGIYDDTGLAVTGLVAATFPAVSFSLNGPTAATAISLSDLSLITSAYSSGGVKERSNGRYRLDLPATVFSSGTGEVTLFGEASGKHLIAPLIEVTGMNLNDAVHGGLTALPNAAASAYNGLATYQQIAKEIYGALGVVWFVTSSGNDSTGDGKTWSTAYATVSTAMSVASAGDVVVLGAGTIAQAGTKIDAVAGVNVIGQGMDVSIITSTVNQGTTGSAFIPGSKSLYRDFTVQAATSTTSIGPIGSLYFGSKTEKASQGVNFLRVKTISGPDGFHISRSSSSSGADCEWTLTQCQVVSGFDAIATAPGVGNNRVICYDCDLLCDPSDSRVSGTTGTGVTVRGLIPTGGDVVKFYRGSILAQNGSSDNSCAETVDASTIELYSTRLYSAGTGSFDVNNGGGGSVVISGCSFDSTKTNGTITYRDPVTTKSGAGASILGATAVSGLATTTALATAQTAITAIKTKSDLIATNGADSPELVTAIGTISTNLNATVSSRSTYAGGAVASVTGAVGSVTGNVGGNVTGSVGSVVGAVGSVTGNVGGSVASVVGAVGSVTGPVGSVTAAVSLAANQHVIVDSGTVTTLTNLPSIPANWITAAGINAGALNGKGDWLLATNYTAPANSTIGVIATVVSANLDVAVSSRLAGSSYTAPDNTDIAAIAVITAKVNTMLAASGGNWTYTSDAVKNAPMGGSSSNSLTKIIHSGVATSATSSTIVLDLLASDVVGSYIGSTIVIYSGTGSGQYYSVSAYNPSTQLLSITGTWSIMPDSTSKFAIVESTTITDLVATIIGKQIAV